MITTKEKILSILSSIPDPEIPVINILELGVVRGVEITDNNIQVLITPTYSGCPAMKMIEQNIFDTLHQNGFENISVKTVLAPAWTTDWMNEEAKQKLKEYGIAPPEKKAKPQHIFDEETRIVKCPRCNSSNTELKSHFGSTACKALYTCKDCLEPFDHFKCI